jgi:uncharacterized protein YecT (DUF1311 family)
MKSIRFVLAHFFISFATISCGQAEDCGNPSTQSAMDECADASFRKADAALNSASRQIMSRLKNDEDAKRQMTAAQRAWAGFRDAECTFAASKVARGSAYGMVVTSCKEALTAERVKRLQTYLECEEGDLSCPVPAAN